jgi:dextranase
MQDGKKKLEKLSEHFPVLINNTRKQLEAIKKDIGLFFNAVNNWSIETVVSAEQDAVYIEVWDPCDRYLHLYHLINRAKELGKKPVILAAYISAYLMENDVPPEYAENCLLLASTVIFASGGYHILLGEKNGILAHPYFIRYGVIRNEFERILRNYYDFIVRYANLLYDPELADVSMTHVNGINDDYRFSNGRFSSYGEADKIWTIIKEKPGYKIINLINFSGIHSDVWNEPKEKRPSVIENIVIKALINEDIKGVFVCSPDINNGIPQALNFEFEPYCRGKVAVFKVPKLDVWDLIYIEVK